MELPDIEWDREVCWDVVVPQAVVRIATVATADMSVTNFLFITTSSFRIS
jgi:hypothetical protein